MAENELDLDELDLLEFADAVRNSRIHNNDDQARSFLENKMGIENQSLRTFLIRGMSKELEALGDDYESGFEDEDEDNPNVLQLKTSEEEEDDHLSKVESVILEDNDGASTTLALQNMDTDSTNLNDLELEASEENEEYYASDDDFSPEDFFNLDDTELEIIVEPEITVLKNNNRVSITTPEKDLELETLEDGEYASKAKDLLNEDTFESDYKLMYSSHATSVSKKFSYSFSAFKRTTIFKGEDTLQEIIKLNDKELRTFFSTLEINPFEQQVLLQFIADKRNEYPGLSECTTFEELCTKAKKEKAADIFIKQVKPVEEQNYREIFDLVFNFLAVKIGNQDEDFFMLLSVMYNTLIAEGAEKALGIFKQYSENRDNVRETMRVQSDLEKLIFVAQPSLKNIVKRSTFFSEQLGITNPFEQRVLLQFIADKRKENTTLSNLKREYTTFKALRTKAKKEKAANVFIKEVSKLLNRKKYNEIRSYIGSFVNMEIGKKHNDDAMLSFAMYNALIAEGAEKALEIFKQYSENRDTVRETMRAQSDWEKLIFVAQPSSENIVNNRSTFFSKQLGITNPSKQRVVLKFIDKKRKEDPRLSALKAQYTTCKELFISLNSIIKLKKQLNKSLANYNNKSRNNALIRKIGLLKKDPLKPQKKNLDFIDIQVHSFLQKKGIDNLVEQKAFKAFIQDNITEDFTLTLDAYSTLHELREAVRTEKAKDMLVNILANNNEDKKKKAITAFLNWQTNSNYEHEEHPLYYYVLNNIYTPTTIIKRIEKYRNCEATRKETESRESLEKLVYLLKEEKNQSVHKKRFSTQPNPVDDLLKKCQGFTVFGCFLKNKYEETRKKLREKQFDKIDSFLKHDTLEDLMCKEFKLVSYKNLAPIASITKPVLSFGRSAVAAKSQRKSKKRTLLSRMSLRRSKPRLRSLSNL